MSVADAVSSQSTVEDVHRNITHLYMHISTVFADLQVTAFRKQVPARS